MKVRFFLEPLEERQLLSALSISAHSRIESVRPRVAPSHETASLAVRYATGRTAMDSATLPTSFLAYRITNPSISPVNLTPPFGQALVQNAQPVPGQTYNVLYVAVKNGTAQTFTASNGFQARLSNQARSLVFPVLTGAQEWKPGQWIILYVLTKKYYPVPPVQGGFVLNLGGRISTLVPGPSGIFLRLTYNPATFARTLDSIVAYGQGAQGGAGPKYGLPDTAIYAIVAAATRRNDFGGHF